LKKIILLFVIITFGFTANHIYDEKVKNLFAQLKISEDGAEQSLFSNFSGPSFYLPVTAELKKIAKGERPSIVTLVGNYAKEQSASKEFIARYNQYRENKKPTEPQKPQSAAEMKAIYRIQLEEGIANTDKMIQQLPDMKETFEESKKSLQQQLADLDNPDNPMFNAEMDKMMIDGYNQQMGMYNNQVAEWEEEYPVNNPKKMIKKWLTAFLESSNDVDFNAELAEASNGKQVFVNQNYERKSYMWKLCFRSGKETLETARTFAQNWLNELN
jgi:hypothetical protein